MYFTKKERVVIIIVVCFIAFLSFFKIFKNDNMDEDLIVEESNYNEEDELDTGEKIDGESMEDLNSKLIVHIAGSVKKPGILELEPGSRVVDAIEMCGGLTEDASLDSINLARKLQDEEKIYIPKLGEELEEEVDLRVESTGLGNLIDINTAGKEELISLPGIGDKTADKIIDYREGNLFKTIEDIKNVSGIGEKKFEAIKDMIKVN